jgi:4-hydroxy-tetrahydrodipicolinate synthase
MGADGALVITPYYNKPTQRGLVCHFKAIADAVPEIPVILYNVPGRTGVDMLPETVEELCDIPSVVAIKEATGSLERASEIVVRCGDRITLLSGDDGLTLPLLSVGAKGVISVLANLDPGDLLGLVSAFREGNLEEARRLHCRVHRLSKAMFLESNPIPVKTALKLMGRLNGELRLPLCPMDPALEVTLSGSLVAAGLLNEPIIGTGSRQEVTT